MPTPEAYAAPPPLDELRARMSALTGDPARDVTDFERVAARAREAIWTEAIPPRVTELRVRLAGAGVDGHQVSVHHATQLLDLIQGAITAIGSATRKSESLKTPKDPAGRRVGIREATELRVGSQIGAGSVVFHLAASPALVEDEVLDGTGETDALVDVAVRRFLDVLGAAEADEGSDIGVLTDKIRSFGSVVASKLSQLADETLTSEIDLDLGHWSRGGSRRETRLGSRGAAAIRAAADRNRERTEIEHLVGRLRTVSDGADQLRLTLDDDTNLRIAVDPDLGLTLGGLLGRKVSLEVESHVRWKLATGKEIRTRHLVSAEAAPEVQQLPMSAPDQ